jgi:hypothetical protein
MWVLVVDTVMKLGDGDFELAKPVIKTFNETFNNRVGGVYAAS